MVERCREFGELVAAGELDPCAEVSRSDAPRALPQALDTADDRPRQPEAETRGQQDREREACDRGEPGLSAQLLGAGASGAASALELVVEPAVELDDVIHYRLELIPQLRDVAAIAGANHRHDAVAEVAVVLLCELGDLPGERLLGGRLRDRLEVRDRLARGLDHLGVVAEVAVAELDQGVGLVDVLLANLRRGHVAGVLGVIEERDLRFGGGDALQREQLDGKRRGKQEQHRRERRQETTPGDVAQASRWVSHSGLVTMSDASSPRPGAHEERGESQHRRTSDDRDLAQVAPSAGRSTSRDPSRGGPGGDVQRTPGARRAPAALSRKFVRLWGAAPPRCDRSGYRVTGIITPAPGIHMPCMPLIASCADISGGRSRTNTMPPQGTRVP
ncbi:MAG TPA: hypothetical protein VFK02_08240 [Kofleriaceae bacterium]|nr:hypothetical protein [Kofleriaceae bacterium]